MIFHHVGVVTKDLDNSSAVYQQLGYKEVIRVEDPLQDAIICLLESPFSPLIELISPLSAESHIHSWIKRISAGPYHTCYQCAHLEDKIQDLETWGFRLVSEINSAVVFESRRVVFMWHSHLGIVELLEEKK